jgi:hypothetical protein
MHQSLKSRILPETELLLLAARGAEADHELRALLETPLNWDLVIALVQRDRGHTALWAKLCEVGLDRIPDAPREQLRRIAMVAGFRQATLEQRLDDVLEVLGQSNIDVLLLKGSALALSVYKSFAARPMADLDLLVSPERAAQAQSILLSKGWALAAPVPPPAQQALYARHHHLPPLIHGPARIVLELHTEPLPSGHPFRFSAAELWRTSQPETFRTHSVRVPDLQHQALHLCLHFVWSHSLQFGAWRTLRDLRTLSELPHFDWQQHLQLARDVRAESGCYWAWRLARGLVGARVPQELLQDLAPSRSAAKLDLLERHFVASLFGGVHCPSTRLTRALWVSAIAPARSGHGDARPWTRQHEFMNAGIQAAAQVEGRPASSWRDAFAWQRYLRVFLFRARRATLHTVLS